MPFSSKADLKTALIGVSHWHTAMHARAFTQAGARVVAVYDPDLETAKRVGDQLDAKAYETLEALLASKPDFAVVMGTPVQMPGYVRAVLEAGIPVATEKPLGRNAGELEAILSLAEQSFVSVAFANRYSGVWAALENAGTLSHMHFRIINGSPQRYLRDGVGWVLQPEIAGGGVLRNLGIHGVDAFCALANEPVEVVSCVLSKRLHRLGSEDFASLTLRSASGTVGTIEAGYTFSTLAAGGDYEFRIAAENAYILEQADTLKVTREGITSTVPTVPTGERYDAFARDTLQKLETAQPPTATLSDLYKAMHIIDQAYAVAVRI